jgi:hypothetical protein
VVTDAIVNGGYSPGVMAGKHDTGFSRETFMSAGVTGMVIGQPASVHETAGCHQSPQQIIKTFVRIRRHLRPAYIVN